MSSTAVGFQWGTKINDKSSRQTPKTDSKFKISNKKRRFQEDRKSDKSDMLRERLINKRAKIPIIKGESLPIPRIIESLNHESTTKLLTDLISIHPEISETILKIQPKISLQDSIKLISQKFSLIKENLPYKGDLENDYSYLRIKPFLNEFLNCLSDFILNYLPPIEVNLLNSLEFIIFATNLLLELPNFNNQEFKYIKSKCFEQFSNTWLIILNNIYDPVNEENEETHSEEKLYNFIKIINDLNLKQKLQEINETCENKFDKIIEYINQKFDKFNSNDLNDFITIDYSNYSLTANPST